MRHARVAVTILDRLMGLPAETKAVYFSLLLGPHRTTAPGLFRGGPAALAEACETPTEAFEARIAELEARGLVMADLVRRVVFLPYAVEDDPPANPNTVRSWKKVLDELPPCEVKAQAWRKLRGAASLACAVAEKRWEDQAKKGEKTPSAWSGERWADLLGPEPRAVSVASDTPSASGPPNGSGNSSSNGSGNSLGNGLSRARPTPTPTLTLTLTPTQAPSPSPTQSADGEEGGGLGEGTAPPLAAFASGSGCGDAEDSMKGGIDESEEPPFVPPTREEVLRMAGDNGSTATEREAEEFLTYFEIREWKHQGKALTAKTCFAAFALHRATCRTRLQRQNLREGRS